MLACHFSSGTVPVPTGRVLSGRLSCFPIYCEPIKAGRLLTFETMLWLKGSARCAVKPAMGCSRVTRACDAKPTNATCVPNPALKPRSTFDPQNPRNCEIQLLIQVQSNFRQRNLKFLGHSNIPAFCHLPHSIPGTVRYFNLAILHVLFRKSTVGLSSMCCSFHIYYHRAN